MGGVCVGTCFFIKLLAKNSLHLKCNLKKCELTAPLFYFFFTYVLHQWYNFYTVSARFNFQQSGLSNMELPICYIYILIRMQVLHMIYKIFKMLVTVYIKWHGSTYTKFIFIMYCHPFESETFPGVPLSVLLVGTTQILVNKGKVYLELLVIQAAQFLK